MINASQSKLLLQKIAIRDTMTANTIKAHFLQFRIHFCLHHFEPKLLCPNSMMFIHCKENEQDIAHHCNATVCAQLKMMPSIS
jgi:hypothetical protein